LLIVVELQIWLDRSQDPIEEDFVLNSLNLGELIAPNPDNQQNGPDSTCK